MNFFDKGVKNLNEKRDPFFCSFTSRDQKKKKVIPKLVFPIVKQNKKVNFSNVNHVNQYTYCSLTHTRYPCFHTLKGECHKINGVQTAC